MIPAEESQVLIRPQQSLQLTIVEIEAQRDQAFKKAESERERGEVLEKQERCKAVERTASAASKLVPALLRVVVSSKQIVRNCFALTARRPTCRCAAAADWW